MRCTLPPVLVSFLLFSTIARAQTPEIDSLIKILPTRAGKEKVDLALQIAGKARYVNTDSSLSYALYALELSESIPYTIGKIASYNAFGRVQSTKGNYFLAQKYFTTALELAEKVNNDSFICRSLIGIGNCLWQLGKHAEALEHSFRALRIAEEKKLSGDIGTAKASISSVYQTQEKLPAAEQYISEAIPILRESGTPLALLNAMHTLANIYGMQGKIKEAFAIDEEGLVLAEKSQNIFSKSLFYDNMANCYLFGDPPDYKKAEEYFRKTLDIDSSFGNKKQMSDSYKNLGILFSYQKKYQESIPYFQRAIQLADESEFVQGEQSSLKELSHVYQLMGMHKEAFETFRLSSRLKDSVFNTVSDTRMSELQTYYETEKKQQQIQLQKAELSRKNYIILGTLVSVVLIGLLSLSAWLRYRLKQKAKLQETIIRQQELATRAVIEAEENERQRIARDLHDGVGQMMSAAKMNLSAFESDVQLANQDQHSSLEKIIGLVDESCKEIRSVSHNMMPNALLKNSLAAAVRDFVDKIDKNALTVHIYTEGLDERLDNNTESVLYRVIQECVNNVIRHSEASKLDISLVREKDEFSATIEDNGKGFDSSAKDAFKGIGLRNIQTRVEFLKGTVDFDSSPGRGTVVAIHIPLTHEEKV